MKQGQLGFGNLEIIQNTDYHFETKM